MKPLLSSVVSCSDVEATWDEIVQKLRPRKAILFLSYCRFWEKHPFVQQSLARHLVNAGFEVIWFDGAGWRPYQPKLYWTSPKLEVTQLPELPGRRIRWIAEASVRWQNHTIRRLIRKYGSPVIWVQAGISEGLAAKLPYVDVFSTFDDPYRHKVGQPLCEKARTIICQNSHTYDLLSQSYANKIKLLNPPVELLFADRKERPRTNKTKTLGYIGSFFEEDFDLCLFQQFLDKFPQYRFLLVGRTDSRGEKRLREFKKYSNFEYHKWVNPSAVTDFWNRLDVSLLLYRRNKTQDGAFPIKILDSYYYGVPAIATEVPKTRDLRGLVPMSSSSFKLMQLVDKALLFSDQEIRSTYRVLETQMNPKKHLVESLQTAALNVNSIELLKFQTGGI